jgi:hypothetical protein
LLLFKREATIENDPSSPSKLKNMVAKGSVLAAGNGTIVFSVFPRIPETDYVLVLEASSGTERTNRRMFITGTGSSRGTTFITGDVSFSRFLSNNKTGYKPDELVVKFGKF